MNPNNACVLCDFDVTQVYYLDKNKYYLHCPECGFVFLPRCFHLNNKDEKSRYDLHQNNSDDKGYRQFLSSVLTPITTHFNTYAKGLDFGCGSDSALVSMLKEKGYKVDLFDKYYTNNQYIFDKKYDFITATEVLEHLNNPKFEISRLFSLLNPKGMLAVMTQILTSEVDFSTWYYKNDPTHIGFFSKKTVQYLAQKYKAKFEIINKNTVLFFK